MKYEQRWKIERSLGKGGQGEVFLVKEDPKEDKDRIRNFFKAWPSAESSPYLEERHRVQESAMELLSQIIDQRLRPNLAALKLLHSDENARDSQRARERASLEIKAMRKWQHPNLLSLKDCDSEELWYVSEYHSGGTLDQSLTAFAGDLRRVLIAIRPVVEGVALLHKHNAVHRDIKPHNIFMASDGELTLGDFGLIYVADPENSRLSATYTNVGTHAWMPGWAMEHRVTDLRPTFDVFSLGKVIWAMLSGKPTLNLWYYDRPQNNLQNQFPDKSEMRFANDLFSKCIVEDEEQCLVSAAALLEEIDHVLDQLSRGPNFFSAPRRICKICHNGEYHPIDEEEKRNFGLNCGASVSVLIYACDNCRHIELFYIDINSPPLEWRNRGSDL